MNQRGNTNHFSTKKLAELGLLIALQVLLTHFLSINTPIVRIGFGFLPLAILGMLYGPWTAGLCAIVADLLGVFLFSSAPYFPGFTLTAFLTGFTYGAVLYEKDKSWLRILIAVVLVCLIYNFVLDTFWLYIMMDTGIYALIPTRIVKALIMIPIQFILIGLVWDKFVSKIRYLFN